VRQLLEFYCKLNDAKLDTKLVEEAKDAQAQLTDRNASNICEKNLVIVNSTACALKATKKIEKGQFLFWEDMLAFTSINSAQSATTCGNCFRLLEIGQSVPCPKCAGVKFCSDACLSAVNSDDGRHTNVWLLGVRQKLGKYGQLAYQLITFAMPIQQQITRLHDPKRMLQASLKGGGHGGNWHLLALALLLCRREDDLNQFTQQPTGQSGTLVGLNDVENRKILADALYLFKFLQEKFPNFTVIEFTFLISILYPKFLIQ